jgi:hypothetical protein
MKSECEPGGGRTSEEEVGIAVNLRGRRAIIAGVSSSIMCRASSRDISNFGAFEAAEMASL